jgi:hypothetical protein
LVTPLIEPSLTLVLVMGVECQSQLDEMFFGVKEVQDAGRTRKELLQHVFETRPTVRQGNLLFRIHQAYGFGFTAQLAADGIQLIKSRQIADLMGEWLSRVMLAAWVVDHGDCRHATIGSMSPGALLTDAGVVEADISARSPFRIPLPFPCLLGTLCLTLG